MNLLSVFGKGKSNKIMEYSESDYKIFEEYITTAFGSFSDVFHEIVTPPGDIHLDIIWIKPDEGHDYHTLITMNVGEYKMKVPRGVPNRMELVMRLPKDWDIKSSEEKYAWPFRLMKQLGRYPLYCESYLANGHTICSEDLEPYAKGLSFSNSIIYISETIMGGPAFVELSQRKKVVFYDVIPIYDEELTYSFDESSEALLSLMKDKGFLPRPIITTDRQNYCE